MQVELHKVNFTDNFIDNVRLNKLSDVGSISEDNRTASGHKII